MQFPVKMKNEFCWWKVEPTQNFGFYFRPHLNPIEVSRHLVYLQDALRTLRVKHVHPTENCTKNVLGHLQLSVQNISRTNCEIKKMKRNDFSGLWNFNLICKTNLFSFFGEITFVRHQMQSVSPSYT